MTEDIVSWAVRTHRILASSAEFYRGKLSADPHGTTALLKMLHAVEPDVAAMLPGNRPVAAAASTLSYRAAATFPPGDAYRANPLVDDIQRSRPALYAVASAEATPPTLFASGDLPVYTASGVEPAVLAKIPWMARHAVASASTTAEAYRIIEDVSGADGDLSAHMYADHSGIRQYEERVRSWAAGPPGQSKFDKQELQRADADTLYEQMCRELLAPDRPGY